MSASVTQGGHNDELDRACDLFVEKPKLSYKYKLLCISVCCFQVRDYKKNFFNFCLLGNFNMQLLRVCHKQSSFLCTLNLLVYIRIFPGHA